MRKLLFNARDTLKSAFAVRAARLALSCLACATMLLAQAGQSMAQSLRIVRDAEIEGLLLDYMRPLAQAARLNPGPTRIVMVNDRGFNAFVRDGKHIFIHTGALIDAKTPGEIIGVLAHELGHVAGGHLARLSQEIDTAKILAGAGMIIGAAGAIGATRAGDRIGNSGAGVIGALGGSQELVMRNLLAYQRGEEQAADRAALNYLAATGQSPRGMITTFKRFMDSGMFASRAQDPYLRSHPLPQERIANLEDTARKSPHFDKPDNPALVARHDLARAKLIGFMERPDTLMRAYAGQNSQAARYARAISAYRQARLPEALVMIDGLIKEKPNYAYFWELKGQVLLESGRAREALPALRRAVALAPQSGLIRGMLGHALVATDDPGLTNEAIRELSQAALRDQFNAEPYRFLGQAYARKGDIAMAELSSAQYFLRNGAYKEAHNQAFRAQQKFKEGSSGWLKAEDILNEVPPDKQ
jgi:predicted Zn-dependent protease